MSEQIAVRIPDEALAALDEAVAGGRFANRATAVRAGIDLLLRVEREREIAAEYRRAYADDAQDEWIGDAGLRLGAELVARELEDRRTA